MEKIENEQVRFGLVGKDISYSFSKGYFTEKFSALQLDNHSYENFDLPEIEEFRNIFKNKNNISGLNVTIPYKETVLQYLTELDSEAEKIGAVNTIKITKNGLKGYNTDVYGFQKSIEPLIKKHHTKALILGTGGASKAVAYVLQKLGLAYTFVSRKSKKEQYTYTDLTKMILDEHTVIVNCTPLGTHPNIHQKPDIPYSFLTSKHLLFDLIYNPKKTAFLLEGKKKGASISNGSKMLEFQAEKAWKIWQE